MTRRTMSRYAAVITALLFMAGCSSAQDTSSGPGNPPPGAEPSATPLGPEASAAVPEEVSAADASKPPVTIGFIVTATGPGSPSPSSIPAANATVRYINDHLGGINGHPVVLKTCDTTGEQQQTRICAQQFANDPAVGLVALSNIEHSQDVYPIMASSGLFSLSSYANTSVDATTPNGISYLAGVFGVTPAMVDYAANSLHAKKLAIVGVNLPVGQQTFNTMKKLAEQKGMTVTGTLLNLAEADAAGPLLAAGAQSADAIAILTGASQCAQLAQTISGLGIKTPVITAPPCWDPSVVKASGSKIDGWHMAFWTTPDIQTTDDPELKLYHKVMADDGASDQAAGYQANMVFAQFLSIWSAAKAAAPSVPIDRAMWKPILTSYHGPVALGPRSVSCPGPEATPSICSYEMRVFTIGGGSKPYPVNPVTVDARPGS